MTRELKDLWLLAASVVFAMSCTFLAGSWHTQSYSVAQPQTTSGQVAGIVAGAGSVGASRASANAVGPSRKDAVIAVR
jgi:hypothetical protein